MKILTSMPGKFGDILWSLATVKHISNYYKTPVTFMIMPTYFSLRPLLESQSYIDKVLVNDEWLCTGSPHGDQPFLPQNSNAIEWEYDVVHHLGYRYHPGIMYQGKAVIDFLAFQHGLLLEEPVCPFIEVKSEPGNCIAYAFNPEYPNEKKRFWDIVNSTCGLPVVDVTKLPWHAAAEVINSAMCFIGDRSSNYVMAHGVAQKNIFIFEPNPSRDSLAFNNVFGNPHWPEHSGIPRSSPEHYSDICLLWLDKIKSERSTLCHA